MSRIYLWRYRKNRRNFPGYHLTADAAGVESLRSALSRLAKVPRRKEVTFQLQPVTEEVLAVPGNTRIGDTAVSLGLWKLLVDPRLPQDHFHFREAHPLCELELSPTQVVSIAAGVEDIARGQGDYAIGATGDHVLWFWWYGG